MKSIWWCNRLLLLCVSITVSVAPATGTMSNVVHKKNAPISADESTQQTLAAEVKDTQVAIVKDKPETVHNKQSCTKQSFIQAAYAKVKQKLAEHYRIIGAGALSTAVVAGWMYKHYYYAQQNNNGDLKGSGFFSHVYTQNGETQTKKKTPAQTNNAKHMGVNQQVFVKNVSVQAREQQNKKLLEAYYADDMDGVIAALNAGAHGDHMVPDAMGAMVRLKVDAEAKAAVAKKDWWVDRYQREAQEASERANSIKESGNTLLAGALGNMLREQKAWKKSKDKQKADSDSENNDSAAVSAAEYHARSKKYRILIDLLIKRDANIYTPYILSCSQGELCNAQPLFMAIELGDVQLVRMFLEKEKVLAESDPTILGSLAKIVKTVNKTTKTPLVYAFERLEYKHASKEDEQIMMLLIEAGADINVLGYQNKTILMYAAEQGMSEVVAHLLAQGVDVDAQENDDSSWKKTALMYAAEHSSPEVIKLFIGARAEVNMRDKYEQTALDYTVKYRRLKNETDQQQGHESVANIVQSLLRAGATIDTNDTYKDYGSSGNAFYHACYNGHAQAARLLLTRDTGTIDAVLYKQLLKNITRCSSLKADILALVFEFEGVLKDCVITEKFYKDFLERLVDGCVRVDDALVIMLLDKDKERREKDPVCAVFIEAVTSPKRQFWDNDKLSRTVLMWAIEPPNVAHDSITISDKVVERIINEIPGSYINAQNGWKETALMIAVRSKQRSASCIQALIAAGADVNMRNGAAFAYCFDNQNYNEKDQRLEKVKALCGASFQKTNRYEQKIVASAQEHLPKVLAELMVGYLQGVSQESYDCLVRWITPDYTIERTLDVKLAQVLIEHEKECASKLGDIQGRPSIMKAVNKEGQTLLQAAAMNFRDDIIKVLVESGLVPDVDVEDKDGNSALALAVQHHPPSYKSEKEGNRKNIIQLLVGAKAKVNAQLVKKAIPGVDIEQICTIVEYAQQNEPDLVAMLQEGEEFKKDERAAGDKNLVPGAKSLSIDGEKE